MTHLPPSTLVWFLLVDSDGHPYKRTTVSSISLPSSTVVDAFQEAAHLKNSSILTRINPSQLKVYKDKLAFDGKEKPLEQDSVIAGLGTSETEALIVVVPISAAPSKWFGQKGRTTVFPAPPETTIREPLFGREASIYMQHPPICSVTFFQGDVGAAKLFLQSRLTSVLALNPWLGGKLAKGGKNLELVYPSESVSINDLFTVMPEPVKNLQMSTEYEDLMKACIPLSIGGNGLGNGAKQLKAKCVVSRFVIAPTTSASSDNPGFALVFSLSHAVADGYTYYEILGMLSDDSLASARALNPSRKQEYEAEHLSRLVSPSVLKFGASLTFIKAYLAGMFRKPPARPLAYFIDEGKVKQAKEEHAHAAGSFISTNDIITSHFMTACSPRLGMMAINYRPRCPILDSNDAGNYEEILLSDFDGYQTPAAVRASLVADATGAYVGLDKKKRLPGFWEKCELAFISSWAITGTSRPFDLSLGGKTQQLLHLPILFLPMPLAKCPMDTAIVFRALPNKLALLVFAKKANLTAGNKHPFGACVNPDMFPKSTGPLETLDDS
jgi:hypothetical protein